MGRSLYNLTNHHMRHVSLFLDNGNIIRGYIPPSFWVIRGVCKVDCPQNEETHLAIIREKHWEKYRHRFDSGEKLFAEIPSGYLEVPLERIRKIEIDVYAKSEPLMVIPTRP